MNNDTYIDEYKYFVSNFISLQQNKLSKKKKEFIKKSLIDLLNAYSKYSKKLSINKLNSSFINNYLSEWIFKIHPNYSKTKIIEIQTSIKKFLNYLVLQNVLKKKELQEIINNLYNKTILKRKIDKNFNSKDHMEINIIPGHNKPLFKILKLNKAFLNLGYSINESFVELIDEFSISKSEFDQHFKKTSNISKPVKNIIKNIVKKFNKQIKKPLYYFPNQKDHVLKNWFIYELTLILIEQVNDSLFKVEVDLLNISDILLTEIYVKFCFYFSIKITNLLLPHDNNDLLLSHDNNDLLSEHLIMEVFERIHEKYTFLKTNNFNLLEKDITDIVNNSLEQLLEFCKSCPNHCLVYPLERCTMFENPPSFKDFLKYF